MIMEFSLFVSSWPCYQAGFGYIERSLFFSAINLFIGRRHLFCSQLEPLHAVGTKWHFLEVTLMTRNIALQCIYLLSTISTQITHTIFYPKHH